MWVQLYGLCAADVLQALQDNARLNRKLRTLQDQYAVTSAKKEAFKAQAVRLEREFKKGHEAGSTVATNISGGVTLTCLTSVWRHLTPCSAISSMHVGRSQQRPAYVRWHSQKFWQTLTVLRMTRLLLFSHCNQAEQTAKEAREAVAMMSDMRKSHIQEVRLLQRGLAARGGDEKFRNRVNEVADLVDKLGRAVVQRDE
eukprot:3884571-Amphidinium_carterae.1